MDPCQHENYASHPDGDEDIEDLDILYQQQGFLLLYSLLRVAACTIDFHNSNRRLSGNIASILRESNQLDVMMPHGPFIVYSVRAGIVSG
jgi:hypothetical protein